MSPLSAVSPASMNPALLAASGPAAPRPGRPAPATPEDVQRAAKQFEAILVRQLLAPAVEPMMNGSLGGGAGAGGGVYGYMLTDVLSNSISQGGGLGLAKMLETQLSSRGAAQPAPDAHE